MATMPAQRQLSWDEFSSDGEEIVYLDSVLASPALISEPGDGDYILVPHLRSPSMHSGSPPHSARQWDTEAELSSALSALSLAPAPVFVPAKAPNASKPSAKVQGSPRPPATPKQKRKKKSTGGDGKQPAPHTKKGTPTASAPDSAYPSPPATPAVPRRRKQKKNTPKQGTGETGLGARTVVDDVSDLGDDTDNAAYADARSYIASHLANPPPVLTNGMLLPLLQALIVELGLSAPEHKPSSVTAARGLLKSRAFIGIREYLAAREAGREAIQRAMHPSRTSLVRALRKGSAARAPRAWVKSTGLAVLLVNTHN